MDSFSSSPEDFFFKLINLIQFDLKILKKMRTKINSLTNKLLTMTKKQVLVFENYLSYYLIRKLMFLKKCKFQSEILPNILNLVCTLQFEI